MVPILTESPPVPNYQLTRTKPIFRPQLLSTPTNSLNSGSGEQEFNVPDLDNDYDPDFDQGIDSDPEPDPDAGQDPDQPTDQDLPPDYPFDGDDND
ncbi:MAG: MSCRAMM family adhesin SdrC [Mollicutes bacterium UO1]